MRRLSLIILFALGCQAPPEPKSPIAPSANATEYFHHSLDAVLSAAYVASRFEGQVKDESGAELSARGIARWYRSGVLLIELESAGGEALRLLRIGDRAWRFKQQPAEWALYEGPDRPGTGLQDPYGLVAGINVHRESFKFWEPKGKCFHAAWDDWELEPAPAALASLFHCLVPDLRVNEGATRLRAEALIEEKGLGQVKVKGVIAGSRNGTERTYKVDSSVQLLFQPAPPPMQFEDIPAPFTPDMKAAVRKAMREEGK